MTSTTTLGQLGQRTTYGDTVGQKRVVTDRILMIDPMSIAGINALGLHNESKFNFVNAPGKMYEWLEDTYSPRSDTAVSGLSSDSTSTQVVITNGGYFQVGDVLQIDSEYLWVSAITNDTLTVTRDWRGTQATHEDTSTVYIRTRARLEGASAGDGHSTSVTSGYNYTSILQKSIEISRTDSRIQRYGVANAVDHQIDKVMDELMMMLNLGLYHSERGAGSTSTPRSFGGLDTFITTNVATCSSAALTQKNIEDEIAAAWSAGGNPTLLICNTWAKRKIADFYSPSVRTVRDETRGGITINQIESPLGVTLDVLVDRHCPTNELYILDQRYVGFITLDDFFEEELAKTKDTAYYGQVVGEYGFVVAFQKAHAIVSGFSTTA
jgi:hypothetical protein